MMQRKITIPVVIAASAEPLLVKGVYDIQTTISLASWPNQNPSSGCSSKIKEERFLVVFSFMSMISY
jgi:hypothetical protein